MLNKPAAVGCLLKMPNVGAKRDDSSFYYALAFTSGLETTGISYFLFTTVGENKLEFIGWGLKIDPKLDGLVNPKREGDLV